MKIKVGKKKLLKEVRIQDPDIQHGHRPRTQWSSEEFEEEEQSAEIEDLMSQEDEELKFTEKWNAGEDVDDPWETEL